MLELNTPQEIYKTINDELESITQSLVIDSTDIELKKAQNKAYQHIVQHQRSMETELSELEKNAEWHTFTIAFYGETGAGKSTLIETLRIQLQEPTKVVSRQKFAERKKEHIENESQGLKLQEQLKSNTQKLTETVKKTSEIQQQYKQPVHDAETSIEEAKSEFIALEENLKADFQTKEQNYISALNNVNNLKKQIAEFKLKASLWQKLLNIFTSPPEQKALAEVLKRIPVLTTEKEQASNTLQEQQQKAEQRADLLNRQLSEIINEKNQTLAPFLNEQAKTEQEKLTLERQRKENENRHNELQNELTTLADGEIIGNGRADFTRETQRYDFTLNDTSFALLDVPGIEGKEGDVLEEILEAVQTAHAVFYVTNQAAPPQTGDEHHKGTLEKIKEHLGAQTEVWAVFNKKIKNPKYALKDRPLISEDENESLSELSNRLQEQLGVHYQGVFSLSALQAFLASTEHFMPNSPNAKQRNKAMEDFSTSELLEKSNMQAFKQLLGENILHNSEEKIIRANIKKTQTTLENTCDIMDKVQQDFSKLRLCFEQNETSAQLQLNDSFKALEQRLQSQGEILINNLIRKVRSDVYSEIDYDISNNDFKYTLENSIEQQQIALNQKLPEALSVEAKKFQDDIQQILVRFQALAEEIESTYNQFGNTQLDETFRLNIKIDNGVNSVGLISGLVGLVAAPFTGGASVWLALGSAFTVAVGMFKSVVSVFNSNYKKSQQREATNKNLRNVKSQLQSALSESLDQVTPDLSKVIEQLHIEVSQSTKQVNVVEKVMSQSLSRLNELSQSIEHLGASSWNTP